MDQPSLSLNWQCRNARLCLKKASFSKKSRLFRDELTHLQHFETLVENTIPKHADFESMKEDKQIIELKSFLADARKRIKELEDDTGISSLMEDLKKSSFSNKSDKTADRANLRGKLPKLSETSTASDNMVSTPKSMQKSRRNVPITTKDLGSMKQREKQEVWDDWAENAEQIPVSPSSRKLFNTSKSRESDEDTKCIKSSSNRDSSFHPSPKRRAPDQTDEITAGGPAVLPYHLQRLQDERDDLDTKNEELITAFPASDNISNSWFSNYSKSREQWDQPDAFISEDDVKTPEKHTVGKRQLHVSHDCLQKTPNHVQKQCSNADEDAGAKSVFKLGISSAKSYEKVFHGHEGTLSRVVLSHSTFDSSLKDMHIEDCYAPRNKHFTPGADVDWDRKIDSLAEELNHEILHSCTSPRHFLSTSGRKKHRKKDTFSAMDKAKRQAVKSDSDDSNVSIVQYDAAKLIRKSSRSLQQRKAGEDKKKRLTGDQSTDLSAFQGLQTETFGNKIVSLQNLVGDLKRSVEGFTSKVEKDVAAWECRVQGVEKNLTSWRSWAEQELLDIKSSIEAEVHKKLDELSRGFSKTENILAGAELRKECNNNQRLDSKLEECATQLDILKRQVDSLILNAELNLDRGAEERVQDINQKVKAGIDLLDLRISNDLESLRKELDEKFSSFCMESEESRIIQKQQIEAWVEEKISKKLFPRLNMVPGDKAEMGLHMDSEKLGRTERQQLEALIEQKFEKCLSQKSGSMSFDNEKVIAEMKTELHHLWSNVDLLIKGRAEIKDNMEHLNHIAEKAKEAIGKEYDLLKTENGSLKKELQYFKNETMQIRIDTDVFRKDIKLDVADLRATLRKLKEDREDVKRSMDCLKRMRDDLISDKKTIRNLVDGFREEFSTKIRESAMVQRGGDQFEILKEGAQDGNRDKALMERLEKLSQLYLGGLEEVRQDLKIMKTDCDEKLHDLESQWEKLRQQQDSYPESEDSLRQLVLDGFESRLSHLEHFLNEKENFDEEQSRVQNSIAVIEDNREQAVSALAIVTAASQKAEEFLKNILGAFHSQMMDIKQESITIQEKLLSEKEAAAATLSEVLKMRDDLRKETESTLSFLSDAKSKSIELQEGLEKESENLRNSLIATRKEKEAVLGAATAAVDQAGRLLGEISEVKRKSVHFSDEVAQALGETRKKYGEMVGGHIEECRKTMLNEISKAKEYVEVIEEEKRKSSHIVEVIKEEKRKSVCLAEAVAFREKVEFEQHKQATEMTINELAETVREMSASLDSKLQGLSQMQVHSQEQDERLKREIGDMNEKSAMLQQEVSALDDFLRKAIAEQAIIVDKVKNVEESQIDLANSVGGIQGSIAELEQSGVTWVQKYDTAARILQDIERRLSSLESASFDADKPDEQLSNVDSCHRIAPREKLQLIKLHRELSCFLQKMKSDQKIDNSFEDEWSKAFNGKIADLDNRMKHVEHDAFPKLIALEAKTEQLSTGMQTALDEASSAESKCGALGAELVKVFRMFASFQKESPTKMLGDAADEDAEQQPQHRSRCTRSHHSGSKSKLHSSNVSCTYCKKVAVKGSNDLVDCGNDHKDAECMEGNSGQNVSFEYQKGGCVYNRSNFSNMCSTREKGYKEPGPQGKPAVECREISHDRASQNEKSHQKGDLMETVHETEGSEHLLMKKNLSELKTLDGKRPAADDKRLECTKKEFTHTGSGKNCQSTNIRLATGKIHVNVSHSSSRTTKRGDTISVHP